MIYQKLKRFINIVACCALMLVFFSVSVQSASAVIDPNSAVQATDCGRDNGTAVSASSPNCISSTPLGSDSPDLVKGYINPFIKALTILVGVTVVIGVIYGGIEYSTWDGDPKKVANGKRHIRNAAIALIAYVLTLALLNFLIPGGVSVINV